MSPKEPRKPRAKYPGILAEFSGGKWKFRARVRRKTRTLYGPIRKTQVEAYKDREALAGDGTAFDQTGTPKTLEAALHAAREEARARGCKPITLHKHFGGHGGYLLSWWNADTPLKALTAAELVWFIGEALQEGRNPNTLIEKDLAVLGQAFKAAGLPSPIPEAKKIARLRKRPRVKAGLEFGDAKAIIQQVRDGGTPRAGFHADVLELALWTGARAGELAGIRIEDVDLRRRMLTLDGKTGPRLVPIDGPLAEVVKRIRADALAAGRGVLIPGGIPGVRQIAVRSGKRLGVHLNLRIFRHTIALGMIEAGLSLDRVRDQLGHKDITTTAEYLAARRITRSEDLTRLRDHFSEPSGGDPSGPQTT